MARVGELFIALSANTTALTKDLNRATKVSSKSAKQMEKAFKIVGAALIALGSAAAIGLGALIKSSIDTADKMGKMAQSVGLSVESLSGLAFAAELSDINLDELGARLTNLNRRAKEGARGVKSYRQAFDTLGISLTDSQGKLRGTEDLLLDIADRFSKMEDGTMKAALATDIFSNAGVKMIPLLNQGREGINGVTEAAERMGLVISAKTAAAAEKFNDSLTILRGATRGLAFDITETLLPALAGLTSGFAQLTSEKGFLDTLKFLIAKALESESALGAMINVLSELGIVGAEAEEKYRALGKELKTFVPNIDLSGRTAKKSAIEISFMARAIRGAGDAHEVFSKKLADAIDRQNEALEAFANAPKVFADANAELRHMAENLDLANTGVQGLGGVFEAVTPKLELMKDVGQELTSRLSSGFANLILSGDRFSDVLSNLAKQLANMLLQIVLLNALKSAFSGIGILGFEHGGRPPIGRPSLVGEAGPELFVPDRSGTIISNDAIQSVARGVGGKTVVVNQHFDFRGAGPGVMSEVKRGMRQLQSQTLAIARAQASEAALRTA